MKKVSILVWNDYTIDKRVSNISRSLRENGFDVTVIAAKPWQGLPVIQRGEEKVIRIPLFSSIYAKPRQIVFEERLHERLHKSTLLSMIKNNKLRMIIIAFINCLCFNLGSLIIGILSKPDIVYANDLNTLTVGYFISRICKAKLIFDSHELWLYGGHYQSSTIIRKKWWSYIQKKLIKRVNNVIVTTPLRAEILKRQYNLEDISIIKNCPRFREFKSEDLFRKEFSIPKNITILLYQGALTEARGIFTIVDVIVDVQDVAMVFMGIGADKLRLKEYIKKKGLNKRVFIKDAVPPNKLLQYTASADIGLQLIHNININHYSTISNKIFEYIMAGIAILASDFPEIRKIVVNNDIGLVVDPDNPSEILDKLQLIIDNSEKIKEYKKNAKKIRKFYTWEKEELVLKKIFSSL